MNTYDLAIVGMGFAGYSGAIYASRYGLKNVIVGEIFGGQTVEAYDIGNYPGFETITGLELMQRVQKQALDLGTAEQYGRVEKIEKSANSDESFAVTLTDNETIQAKNVLLTIGMQRRKLNVPGEKELYGKGVTYCATCDGFFFKGKTVAVIGGGDSAATSALYLAAICPDVHLIVRGDKLKIEQFWKEKIEKTANIHVHYNTKVTAFLGAESLEKMSLDGDLPELPIDGVFIEIGHEPNKDLTEKIGVATDEYGYIIVDKEQQTSIPGIYAAGDATTGSNKFAQLLTAASEAAIAAEAISNR